MVNSTLWGVDLWGQALTSLWSKVKDGKGKNVMSYSFNNLPEAITVFPCAISFIDNPTDIDYSMGGLSEGKWRGSTEFHLTSDIKKPSLSYVWQFHKKIVEAAAASLTLNGLVQEFKLSSTKSIELAVVTYGAETEHYGLIVNWEILESLVGKLTVGE